MKPNTAASKFLMIYPRFVNTCVYHLPGIFGAHQPQAVDFRHFQAKAFCVLSSDSFSFFKDSY